MNESRNAVFRSAARKQEGDGIARATHLAAQLYLIAFDDAGDLLLRKIAYVGAADPMPLLFEE